MKTTVKILALVLAMLTLMPMLLACQEGTEAPATNANQPTETTLNLVTKGVTQYVIVRDYKASEGEVNAVLSIVQAAKTFLGVDFVVKECYSDIDDPADVVMDYEILVGMTNRPESRVAMAGLRDADCTMQVIGNKLVLGGPGTKGTEKAVMQFLTSFVYEQGDRYAVAAGKLQSLVFSSKDNKTEKGTYSYTTTCEMLGARVDSFGIYYAKDSVRSDEYKNFADEVNNTFLKETGYELGVVKDTGGYADYEILIGNTLRTKAGLMDDLEDNEYYIELEANEKGGRLYIVYGKDAYDAAMKAVKEKLVPPSKEPIDLKIEAGFVLTNK